MPDDAQSNRSLTVQQFADDLKELRDRRGRPSYSELENASKKTGMPLSRTMLAAVFTGKVFPRWERVETILRILERFPASPNERGTIDLTAWRAKYQSVDPPHLEVHESNVQTNIFQSGREYPYIAGENNVVVGAANFGTIHSADVEDAVDQNQEYLQELEAEITSVAKNARRRLVSYRIFRFVGLAASAVTPAVALLDAAPWITAGIGTLAFFAEGAIQLTRLNERAVLDTKRVSSLSKQFRMYRTNVGEYTSGDNFTLLVQRIEEIREENDNERLNVVQQSFGSHVQNESRPAVEAGNR